MNVLQKFWDQQYTNPKIVSGDVAPRRQARRFVRFIKKQGKSIENLKVLDLGCGNGRHAALFFEHGATVWGWDISATAIGLAKHNYPDVPVENWQVVDIAKSWPVTPTKVDVVLDIMSFHHIMPSQVDFYFDQLHSRLAKNGLVYLYTFNRGGDKNAAKLIKQFGGSQPNTYILPGNKHAEHAISAAELLAKLNKRFSVLQSKNIWGFQHHDDRKYKRHYQQLILQKISND